MANHWWVNHKRTFKEEIEGGYLWSPKREKNGVRSQFYENMRLAVPGDLVISYANRRISHVGKVEDFALATFKPAEFSKKGENWSSEGWLLPVVWEELLSPIYPANFFEEFKHLLPTKYSPLRSENSFGNQKAYFTSISPDLFLAVLKNFATIPILRNGKLSWLDSNNYQVEQKLFEDLSLSITERAHIAQARRGQGVFKSNVAKFESACRITGISHPSLLIASHIKPWRLCNSSFERLDGNNGLLLTPNVDHLFDKGLITFLDSGQPMLSQKLSISDFSKLGLELKAGFDAKPLRREQAEYMAFHREHLFIDEC